MLSYIKKQNKTAITKKKTKRKEKEGKEKKRREKGSGPSMRRTMSLPLSHVEHSEEIVEKILLKPFPLELPPAKQSKPNVNAFHRI